MRVTLLTVLLVLSVWAEPNETDPLQQAVTQALDDRQPAHAQALLAQWLVRQPENLAAQRRQLQLYGVLGAPAAVIATANRLLSRDDLPQEQRYAIQLRRAQAMMETGEHTAAWHHFNQLAELPDWAPDVATLIADYRQASYRTWAASVAADQAGNEAAVPDRLAKAGILIEQAARALADDRLIEAAMLLEQSRELAPPSARLLHLQLELGTRIGDPQLTARALAECWQLYAPLPIAWEEAASIALAASDWPLLLALSEAALQTDPDAVEFAFYQYLAAWAMDCGDSAAGIAPIARMSRFAHYLKELELLEGAVEAMRRRPEAEWEAKFPMRLRPPFVAAPAGSLVDRLAAVAANPENELVTRALAARFHTIRAKPYRLPPRASDTWHLPQDATLDQELMRSLAPGQRLAINGAASLSAPPAQLDALRLVSHHPSRPASVRIAGSPALRLLDLQGVNLQAERLLVEAESILLLDRGRGDLPTTLHGAAQVRGGSLRIDVLSDSARLIAEDAHLDLPRQLKGQLDARLCLIDMPLWNGRPITLDDSARFRWFDSLVHWPGIKPAGKPLLAVAEGAHLQAIRTSLSGIQRAHLELPASGVDLRDCRILGDGDPGNLPQRYIPSTSQGRTTNVASVDELRRALETAQRGDIILLMAGDYRLQASLSLPDGVILRGEHPLRSRVILPLRNRAVFGLVGQPAAAFRLLDIGFVLEIPIQNGYLQISRDDRTKRLVQIGQDGAAIIEGCTFQVEHMYAPQYAVGIASGGLAVIAGDTKLGGGLQVMDHAFAAIRADIAWRHGVLHGPGRVLAALSGSQSLTMDDPATLLRGVPLQLAFTNGAGDPRAKAEAAQAVQRQARLWTRARDRWQQAWDQADSLDARRRATLAFSRAVLAADTSDDVHQRAAAGFIMRAVRDRFQARLDEAPGHYFAMRLSSVNLVQANHFGPTLKEAMRSYANAALAGGLDSSEAEKQAAAQFFSQHPPGSQWFTVVDKLVDQGYDVDQIKQQLQAHIAAEEARRERERQALARQQQYEEMLRREARERAAAASAPTRSWQEAYADYKASRPPLISVDQMRRARANNRAVMRRQNEQFRQLGYREMYHAP